MSRLAVALLGLMTLTSCLTGGARQEALLPSIQGAWPGVREDISYGGRMSEEELMAVDIAVEMGAFDNIDLDRLVQAADAGIVQQLLDGVVGVTGAEILRDRVDAFRRAIEEYVREVSLV